MDTSLLQACMKVKFGTDVCIAVSSKDEYDCAVRRLLCDHERLALHIGRSGKCYCCEEWVEDACSHTHICYCVIKCERCV